MKNILPLSIGLALSAPAFSQGTVPDSTGLPGDRFSIQGALELFKNAKDLEGFERALNTEDQHVNNLDLDGDGEVDYVRVTDHAEGDAHAITLQVALGKDEVQDVAVIELEKNGDASAVLQIRGAEDLYGPDMIMEPFEEGGEAPRQKGPAPPPDGPRPRIWVNVWAWPCVTWIYGPGYVAWVSPWHWGYYPPWWRPWRPWGWSAWHGWNRPYRSWYRHVSVCRVATAHAMYQHRAAYSPAIRQRTQAVRAGRAQEVEHERRPGVRQAPSRQGTLRQPGRSPQRTARPAPTQRSGTQRGRAPVRRSR